MGQYQTYGFTTELGLFVNCTVTAAPDCNNTHDVKVYEAMLEPQQHDQDDEALRQLNLKQHHINSMFWEFNESSMAEQPHNN